MFAARLVFGRRLNSHAMSIPASAANTKTGRAAMTRPMAMLLPIHRTAYRKGSFLRISPSEHTVHLVSGTGLGISEFIGRRSRIRIEWSNRSFRADEQSVVYMAKLVTDVKPLIIIATGRKHKLKLPNTITRTRHPDRVPAFAFFMISPRCMNEWI